MGEIIQFNADRNQKETMDSFALADAEFVAAAKKLEESNGEDGVAEFLSAMGKMAKEIFSDKKFVEERIAKEKAWYEDFLRRNKEVINNEPKFDAGLRMQYYAQVLLNLVTKVFHDEDGFAQPFDDFAYFHDLFDDAFSDFKDQYEDLEENYCFSGELIYDKEELERLLVECLTDIIQLKPNESDRDKTLLMNYGSRLFELHRNLLYYVSDGEVEE